MEFRWGVFGPRDDPEDMGVHSGVSREGSRSVNNLSGIVLLRTKHMNSVKVLSMPALWTLCGPWEPMGFPGCVSGLGSSRVVWRGAREIWVSRDEGARPGVIQNMFCA